MNEQIILAWTYYVYLTQLTIIILDVDECATGVHNCKSNERCVNKPGRFVCRCLDGYESVNNMCVGTY